MFFCNSIAAQNKVSITGTVNDSLDIAVPAASIIISDNEGGLIRYGITNDNGEFSISIPKDSTDFVITVNSLGYNKVEKKITRGDIVNLSNLKFVLVEKANALEEVVITSTRPIVEKKDTIIFNADYYTRNTDQSIEDVLKNIPGMSVDSNGKIKYGNQEIKKILIDGDDMVDEQYTILSKNLDSKIIETIQVLKKFDDNPLRRKYGDGNEIALNLTVKDAFKNIVFGKVDAGIGNHDKLDSDLNIGFLSGNFKTLHLSNYNSIGKLQENADLGFGNNLDGLKDDSAQRKNSLRPVLQNNYFPPSFLENTEKVLNKSLLTSQSFNYKWNKKSSLRFAVEYRKNDRQLLQKNQKSYNTIIPVNYSEDINLNEKNPDVCGNFTYTFYNQKNLYITWDGRFQSEKPNWNQRINTLTDSISTFSEINKKQVNNHVKVSYQPKDNLIWDNYIYQTYQENNESDRFPAPQISEQNVFKKEHLLGLSSKVLLKSKRDIYQLQVGAEQENNDFSSAIFQTNIPDRASRYLEFFNSYSYLTYKHSFVDSTKVTVELGSIYKKGNKGLNDFTLPMLGAGIQRSFKKVGQFSLNYQFKMRLSDLNDVYTNTLFTSYRSLGSGLETPFRVRQQSVSLLHNKQVLGKSFIWFSLLNFTNYDKGVITYNSITQDATVFSLAEGKGGSSLLAQSNVTTYVKPLSSSLKVSLGYNYFKNYLAINENNISASINNTYDFSTDITTYFFDQLLLKTNAKMLYQENTFQGQQSDFTSFGLNNVLSYTFSEGLTTAVENHFYAINKEDISFLSLELFYKIPKKKWEFSLRYHNILDNRLYTARQFDDYVTTTSTTTLINSYILLHTIYRF